MVITFITANGALTNSVGSPVRTTIDTTDATLLVVGSHCWREQSGSISDNKGNTWYGLNRYLDTAQAGGAQIFYSYDVSGSALSVGSDHTFTLTSGQSYKTITVSAWKGSRTDETVFDRESGSISSSANVSIQLPSFTPSEAGSLLICLYSDGYSTNEQPTIDDNFSIATSQYNGNDMSGTMAYLIGGDTVDPKWTTTETCRKVGAIAAFRAAISSRLAKFGRKSTNQNYLIMSRKPIHHLATFNTQPITKKMYFSDDFNRGNQNPLSGSWAAGTLWSGVQLLNNRISTSETGEDTVSYYTIPCNTGDHYSKLKVVGSVLWQSIIVRMNLDAPSYFYALAIASTSNVRIYKCSNNTTYSQLASFSVDTIVANDTIKLSVDGSILYAYINDVQVGSYTDTGSAFPGTYRGVGVNLYNAAGNVNFAGDDWEGGDL